MKNSQFRFSLGYLSGFLITTKKPNSFSVTQRYQPISFNVIGLIINVPSGLVSIGANESLEIFGSESRSHLTGLIGLASISQRNIRSIPSIIGKPNPGSRTIENSGGSIERKVKNTKINSVIY
ncbi:hypothetical protein DERP_002799 [Dermatophagoides pteronyssinus]|uniref:Uncharacterized protein n=1 Tax=Dermatophagoides pteronyssinus TaxID=6956 RepID=A0ABQ8JVP0_DERPT|nr:hypothetical protein DERP_002799 [Dermatophagoides pteronyssinus]